MIAINYSNLRENLKKYCDKASKDFETIVVTRKNNENVVMISEDEYNNMLENIYIRSSQKNYKRLKDSIANAETGNVKTKELLDNE